MKKRLLNFKGLFSNTKFLIVFSIVLSFIFWIVVALEYTPITQELIEDVPVKIDLSGSTAERLGYKTYGVDDLSINIIVEGKRYEVGKLTADDFEVEAQTIYVDSAGEKALPLKVVPKNSDAEFEIISLSSDYVNVFFDEELEKEITISPDFVNGSDLAADGYLFDPAEDVVIQSLKIIGPRTELDKISEGKLEIKSTGNLTESTSLEGKLKLTTASDSEVKYVTIDGVSAKNYTHSAYIKIYKEEVLPVVVDFENEPEYYKNNPIPYSVQPESIKVNVLQKGEKTEESVKLKIDFKDISTDNYVFVFYDDDITNVKSENAKIVVRVDVGNISQETISFTPDDLKNNTILIQGPGQKDFSENYSVDFDVLSIDVCANEHELAMIDEKSTFQYVIYVDEDSISPEGGTVPLEIRMTESDQCWVTGTYYVNVKPK